MNDPALHLLARLADGRWHGGPALSDALGVSRAAIWKQVEVLRGAALPIESDPACGYRLARPIALLSAERIAAAVPAGIELDVLERCASTNAELAGGGFGHRRAVLAEWQQAGRGRRGRSWIAPPGGAMALSFGFRFEVGLPRLGPLSLVAGLACAEALAGQGVSGVGLKWPNDLVAGGAKLGGLLVELQGSVDGPCSVVVGVGINVWLPEPARAGIDQPVTDLAALGVAPDRRNELAAALVTSLDAACERFEKLGFAPFAEAWAARDVLAGRAVDVHGTGGVRHGVADGVSERGGLWLRTDAGREELAAGEVSLRARV
ncbi:biotin--[acetyl-CoA-carboxylase] ligase [Wenzhouxiangella sp. XN79A]|uniref:biotin--[acetyl-CoA-carboxylase] ligase n=1 Tax=Wenzhouxiangella sp. XN79A TaxID=2724193 RepID=UPI00144AF517|nr:biotin--[acetyl-CoA-carboxylase] ligase [Wenzhouxiangella sp. XN79A]NKI34251.1 biotin--[acetyl-CoA-carboxylase] ligase [Wenzhouxiangella sp. XN79A]